MPDQDTAQQDFGSTIGSDYTVFGLHYYFASCGCGWFEYGWAKEEQARRALNNHVVSGHSRKQVSLFS